MTTFSWWQVSAIKRQVYNIKLSEFCCWLVARVLQVEIRFVVKITKAQMLTVILS